MRLSSSRHADNGPKRETRDRKDVSDSPLAVAQPRVEGRGWPDFRFEIYSRFPTLETVSSFRKFPASFNRQFFRPLVLRQFFRPLASAVSGHFCTGNLRQQQLPLKKF